MINQQSTINDILKRPEFSGFGEKLFPMDLQLSKALSLQELSSSLPWYSHISTERSVAVLKQLSLSAQTGQTIFYDIYTEKEKGKDPRKARTGLFFFRGEKGASTAIISAGGGFQYVAAIHDSFPHAQELSRQSCNAFALIYRSGARTGSEDLARAIAFLHEHQEQLGIDMTGYSLWGGSAGARMAAWLGNTGPGPYGEKLYPKPSAVIMQYTGLSEVTGQEPATFAAVGTSDWIADYRIMERRIQAIKSKGTPAEIRIYQGLQHGFGLGEGTKAEAWIDQALHFWQEQLA
ncbi:alpha/beta hydrolase [Streptococcus macacae]|uniref:Dienelactone hydrolase family protein n=1 Tax=Streptococcus macacae NCTC 11558 TaxID=764298 RepID=G5JZ41_9STRE|nr:alpha/beta hydrolase [Streptococcus macacae]EHJ51902.1 dienelactone hydrolase family protein [Streptococcus macacae NCTC 11558]SUN78294.1 Prolyl oligopeptidase family [Streptococcus macacae NCTC 11558]